MSATIQIEVPDAIKALSNDQLLALFNRWGTKPCKKFEKRSCGEQRVAKLLADLEMSVEEACAPPSDGYGGEGWDAAFPQEDPAGPPEATVEAQVMVEEEIDQEPAQDEPTELPVEAAEPQPRTVASTILAIGGLPENSDPMAWAPDLANKLKRPIHILSLTGELLQTVEPGKAKERATKAVGRPRSSELGDTAQAIYDLAIRPEGASAKELMAATGWKAGPSWPNTFKRLSLRVSKRFHQEKVDGEMRYFLS